MLCAQEMRSADYLDSIHDQVFSINGCFSALIARGIFQDDN